MTNRERAEQVVNSEDTPGACKRGRLIYAIEEAINAAVEEEREACAKIADRDYVSIQTVTMSDGEPEESEEECCAERCLIIRDGIRARCNGGTK